ncbi:GNAT family N-acetyltransferase [Providencia stuartii]|uniref:GNAT family N-acetyltransferase n=1 Tax=Providencia stuartii TaxID=588 RepID=A0AAJ1N4W7_PROST|nr:MULTISPECIES: GNAT family N-acetyltransferase [Providencia]EMA3642425.1 GNAT family N-acetyltransferase [Providencia stuartii]MBW3100980.1 GNAT family N-acetyltransferase [Providencia stuartii]MCB5218005.1 GNAT family N-acetyltransferase [Providencia stuartii]MCR4081271.1 GNAT family N-acetyltransferase [Providencia stuartii]MDE5306893.1 GNAT family N-acetyltransferase [Providencia stuartii]
MFHIRQAQPCDAKKLPTIERSAAQVFRGHHQFAWIADDEVQSEQDHLQFIQDNREWVAVDNDDQPIGFINVDKLTHSLHIGEISVCQSWQGKGVGRALIQHILHYALQHHFDYVTLTTFREIPWNAPYYQRFGFSIIDEEALPTELEEILQQEIDAGFNAADRCAMRIKIVRPN